MADVLLRDTGDVCRTWRIWQHSRGMIQEAAKPKRPWRNAHRSSQSDVFGLCHAAEGPRNCFVCDWLTGILRTYGMCSRQVGSGAGT
jgi:hypothetical protein